MRQLPTGLLAVIAALGAVIVAIGAGYGRARLTETRVSNAFGTQEGNDFLVLNTSWWVVIIGGGMIGAAVAINHSTRRPHQALWPWTSGLACLIGATGVAWLLRILTAVDLGTGWVEGRPIRRADGTAVLPNVRFEQAPIPAQCWIESARHEFSSIASFLDTADRLTQLGAPRGLIDRCHAAAADERQHTDVCLRIAEQLGATGLDISDEVKDLRVGDQSPTSVVEMAREALVDGVIGEGFAAARLRRSAERTDQYSAVLSRLARDEQRHADLGAAIIEWCVAVDPLVRGALFDELGRVAGASPAGGLIESLGDRQRARAGLCTRKDAGSAWTDAVASAELVLARGQDDLVPGTKSSPSSVIGRSTKRARSHSPRAFA